jgi:uncharacterized protein YukE
MATIQDLVAECDGDAEKIREAQARITEAKQTAEALIDELSSMGMDGGTVNHLQEVVRYLHEAMAQTSSMLESVGKARDIAASAEYGLTGRGGSATSSSPESAWRNEVGEPVEPPKTGPPESPDFVHQELGSADDEDPEMSRANRAMRSMSRNVGDFQDATQDIIDSSASVFRMYKGDKPSGGVSPDAASGHAQAQVPVPQPKFSSDNQQGMSFDAMVVTAVVGSVTAIQGIKTLRRRRRRER